MTKDEALKLAVEALELSAVTVDSFGVQRKTQHSITAIKEALAQPAQEPVGYMNAGYVYEMQQGRLPYGFVYPKFGVGVSVALYTTPPQRPWVGLTDEDEIDWEEGGNLKDLVKAIEEKLKQKNT